jgi:hypothetical protein
MLTYHVILNSFQDLKSQTNFHYILKLVIA